MVVFRLVICEDKPFKTALTALTILSQQVAATQMASMWRVEPEERREISHWLLWVFQYKLPSSIITPQYLYIATQGLETPPALNKTVWWQIIESLNMESPTRQTCK